MLLNRKLQEDPSWQKQQHIKVQGDHQQGLPFKKSTLKHTLYFMAALSDAHNFSPMQEPITCCLCQAAVCSISHSGRYEPLLIQVTITSSSNHIVTHDPNPTFLVDFGGKVQQFDGQSLFNHTGTNRSASCTLPVVQASERFQDSCIVLLRPTLA